MWKIKPRYIYIFIFRLNDLHIVFIIIGGVMAAFSLILLLVGFLATGATRERVYRGFKSRMGGRLSCAFVSIVVD